MVNDAIASHSERQNLATESHALDLALPLHVQKLPRFEVQLEVSVRQAHLLHEVPWVRTLSKLSMEIATEGWRFPSPQETTAADIKPDQEKPPRVPQVFAAARAPLKPGSEVRIRPSADAVLFQERLLYLLQPPLETTFQGPQCALSVSPVPLSVRGHRLPDAPSTPCLPTRWGSGRPCRPSWRCGFCSRPA